ERSAHDIMVSIELGHELPLPATQEQTTPVADVAELSSAVDPAVLPAQRDAEPEPLPHPLPWQRQHGRLSDAELAKAYAAAQKTIGTGQAKATSATTQADAIDAGLGPASVALAERRAELARQAGAIERARLTGKAYREAAGRFDGLQAEWRDAHRRKREATGKISDRKDRRAAEADIVRLDALIEQAAPMKAAAQNEYFRAQALLPHGGTEANERITAEHRHHMDNAAAMTAAAAAADAERAGQLRREAAQAAAAVAAAERNAAGLRTEAQTRASMPAGYRALEDGVRPIAEPSRFVERALIAALREADRLPDGYRAATDRPYGRHSPDGIAEGREQLETAGAQAAATLAANQAASEARRSAAEQGQGPATAGLRAEHERLRAEAARDAACDPIRERLADAESRAAAAQQAQDEIAPELAKPAWQLRAQLKNPAALKARAQEFGRLADAADADAETARQQLRAAYGGHEPPEEGEGRQALKRFEGNLPVRAEAALETDLADALRRDSLTAHSTMQARKAIAAAGTGLEQIEQETALREQLPPAAVDLEGYVRTEAGRRAAAEAAEQSSRRAQAAAARTAGRGRSPSPGHGYSPTRSITRDPGGPHLGR
ncbi:hypothetical protein, partial [Catenulispora yoronensis]|uniref:hypothetical protein n=1 Tax=Catenulispora yoronensis TaxID=450799 RepID=UPI0031DF09C1